LVTRSKNDLLGPLVIRSLLRPLPEDEDEEDDLGDTGDSVLYMAEVSSIVASRLIT
jgi:hypothetical protein